MLFSSVSRYYTAKQHHMPVFRQLNPPLLMTSHSERPLNCMEARVQWGSITNVCCSSLDTGLWVLSEAGHGACLHGSPEAHPTFHCPLQPMSPKRSLLHRSCILVRMLALNAYQALGRGSSTFVLNQGVKGRIPHFKYSASSGRRQHSRKCYF